MSKLRRQRLHVVEKHREDSVEEVVLWFHQAESLTLLSRNGEITMGDEVRALLPRQMRRAMPVLHSSHCLVTGIAEREPKRYGPA